MSNNFNITNDAIAKRAQELAAADPVLGDKGVVLRDSGCIVWQREKYLNAARKQLEAEAEAISIKKRRNAKPAFTSDDLIKAELAKDEAVEKRIRKCVS